MKDKLLNIISYGLITYPLVAATWQVIPELASVFAQYTSQIAYLTALPSGVLGAVGLKIQGYVNKARSMDTKVFSGLTTAYDTREKSVTEVKAQSSELQLDYKNKFLELKQSYDTLNTSLTQLVRLVQTDLQAKLSNPLIDEKVKALIEGVLDEV